jgi:Domain of unknown function (DUF5659)
MEENKALDRVVFSQRCAGYLMLNGCRLLKVKKDKNESSKLVYFFPDTEFVKHYIDEYRKVSK